MSPLERSLLGVLFRVGGLVPTWGQQVLEGMTSRVPETPPGSQAP